MSEEVQTNNQQVLIIGLVVIAALLAALVGVIIWQQSTANSLPQPAAQSTTAPSANASAPAGMGQPVADVPFDAKTATKVPAGTEPLAFVKAYHEAVQAKKWDEAYKLLPIAKQQSYGDVKGFGEQVGAYGITEYNLGKPAVSGDTITIAAEQVTPQMPITYTWTFKKVGDEWFCASRDMGGTVE